VSRKVEAIGVVCVGWQQVSVGKHHGGRECDVLVTDKLLQFWVDDELFETVARTSAGEIRKKRVRAAHPGRSLATECQGSTDIRSSSINRSATDASVCARGIAARSGPPCRSTRSNFTKPSQGAAMLPAWTTERIHCRLGIVMFIAAQHATSYTTPPDASQLEGG
jgi:hypothetical protein